jgi:hypothetical protein
VPQAPAAAQPPQATADPAAVSGSPARFSELFRRAWSLAKIAYWRIVLFTLIAAAILGVSQALAVFGGRAIGGPAAGAAMSGVVGFLIQAWVGAAFFIFISGVEKGVTIGEALKSGLRRSPGYLWILLLMSAVVYGGSLMLIIPGIIWSISFSVLPYVFAAEGVSGMAALVRARQLVKGDGVWLVGKLFLYFLCVLALLLVPAAIAFGGTLLGPAGRVIGAIVAVIGVLAVLASAPVQVMFMFSLYEDLRRRKDTAPVSPGQRRLFVIAAVLGVLPMVAVAVMGLKNGLTR